MSTPILPFAMWESGTNQNSVPANDNSLRNQILGGLIISDSTDAQPGSPADGDAYIMTGAASGTQWATFDEFDLAIFEDGTWYAFAPVEGIRVNIAGALFYWDGAVYTAIAGLSDAPSDGTGYVRKDGAWAAESGGTSSIGLHSVPIMAGAIQPSVTGGCSAVTSIASAANQPDIVTIDFDPTTQEYAQFAIPMPKSWNEGTVTAVFRWSHPATTTNFRVVWSIQAVGVSNDDTIAVNFGTAQQVADTGGTTNDLYITSQTPAMTVGGSPAAEDTVFFRVSRVTGDGSDTMAVDARLHSVVLYMTTDASTDA